MSDPSRLDSPLAIRAARSGAGPPSAFGNSSTFARPSPASRRRRGSSGPYTSADEDNGPESGQPRFQRSTSSQSVRPSSPASSAFGSQPMSPTSPGVDNTSFHTRAKSPEDTADEDLDHAEVQVEVEHADDEDEEGMQELDETDDVVGQGLLGVGGEALNPRLSRISVRQLEATGGCQADKSSPNLLLRCALHMISSRHYRKTTPIYPANSKIQSVNWPLLGMSIITRGCKTDAGD